MDDGRAMGGHVETERKAAHGHGRARIKRIVAPVASERVHYIVIGVALMGTYTLPQPILLLARELERAFAASPQEIVGLFKSRHVRRMALVERRFSIRLGLR